MKKMKTLTAAAACMVVTACGGLGTGVGSASGSSASTGNVLGSILGAVTNGEALGNVITSVLGFDKVTARGLIGTWNYDGPGCAFTSESALARAGGEVAAVQVEEKLKVQYDRLGFSSSNTYITFSEDGTFVSKIDGKAFSGKWTLDEQTGALNLKGLLLSLNGYTKRNGTGISILFESKKLLTLLQTMAAISGNQTVEAVGEISKNYDGVRLGFDMRK
ncbi:MAG: DUF4923 family protein [Prevotella sp.]|nr:DUF4923 family protein [Prevotella sp.]